MPEDDEARAPAPVPVRWKPIRSDAAQNRYNQMKQKAQEQGMCEEAIETEYRRAIQAVAGAFYERPGGIPASPTLNAELFYHCVDEDFRKCSLGREVPFQFEGDLQWDYHDEDTVLLNWRKKPWSPEYMDYYFQRALVNGDGRGTATMEDGATIKLYYERTAEPAPKK